MGPEHRHHHEDNGVYTLMSLYPCLLAKTNIKLINDQNIFIEELTRDDLLKSPFSDKPQAIKRIIKTLVTYDSSSKNMPICIPKSFLSENVPSENVYISGYHRIIIKTGENDYTGIQAFKLNDNFVTEEELRKRFGDELIYYHIELEDSKQHLIVSDMFVESYQSF